MNWTVLIIVGVLLIALVVFLVKRNMKDEKKFEQQVNNDYHKTNDDEGDTDADVPLK